MQSPLLEYAPFVISQVKASSDQFKSQADTLAQELNLGGSDDGPKPVRYSYKECFDTMRPLINRHLLPPSMQPRQIPYPMGAIQSQPTTTVQAVVSGSTGGGEKGLMTSLANNNRRKFSRMDDNMMIMGLQEYGQKNMEQIR